MNNETDNHKVRKGRLQLLVILAIFLLPLVIAALLHKQYRERDALAVSSNGDLIWPAVPLAPFTLYDARADGEAITLDWMKGRWALVYPVRGPCNSVCQKNTYLMRQIHTSLGKEAHRVQRLLVSDQPASVAAFIGDQYPLLLLAAGRPMATEAFFRQFASAADQPAGEGEPGGLYLVDPHGNLMMRFPSRLDPRGILRDIKRALRNSRIG